MTSIPQLQTRALPPSHHNDPSATTASPARGREMKQNLLSKLRSPQLVHTWEFWHDRQGRTKSAAPSPTKPDAMAVTTTSNNKTTDLSYEERLVHLHTISDVKAFWSTFNNFDTAVLPLRDSIHLFHHGVKPVWEDPRNSRGGAWIFRVSGDRATAAEFWKEVCVLAIGEQLQAAVDSERVTFKDDICGVGLSVRQGSVLVQVWNRDAEHREGVRRVLETVLGNVSEPLKPREGSYYYKRHSEHAGFSLTGQPDAVVK